MLLGHTVLAERSHACDDGSHSCGDKPGITCTPQGDGWACGCRGPIYVKDETADPKTQGTVCIDTIAAAAPEPCLGAGCLACAAKASTEELNYLHGLQRYRLGGFMSGATNDAAVLAVCPRAATSYSNDAVARKSKSGSDPDGELEGCAADGTDAGKLRSGGPPLSDIDFTATSTAADAPLAYLQGAATTPVFGVVVGVLTLLAGIAFVVGRWCCRCGCSKDGRGCWGARYPTIDKPAYPKKAVWKARFCMVTFVLLLSVLLGCVQLRGNKALGPAMVAVAEAPHGVADLAARCVPVAHGSLLFSRPLHQPALSSHLPT